MIILIILLVLLIIFLIINRYYEMAFNNKVKKENILKANKPKNEFIEENVELEISKRKVSEVTIKSYDKLKLYGKLIINDARVTKWVIIVHGYSATHSSCNLQANIFLENGYNVLMVDLRAHGQSEGKYIGMGWADRKDIVLWTNFLVKEYRNTKITIYGVSMGAATTMMASGEDLPKNVKTLIVDSGYTSVYDQLVYQCKKLYNFNPSIFMKLYNVIVRIRAKYSLKEASSIKQLEKNKIPILFIQSDNDTFVPAYMIHEVYEATNAPKEKLIIKDGEHIQSHLVNPKKYWDKVFEFINKYN